MNVNGRKAERPSAPASGIGYLRLRLTGAAIPILLASLLAVSVRSVAAAGPGKDEALVRVETSKASGLILIHVSSHRRIGHMVLEVRDDRGMTHYREEGKAMTEEWVRKLDKGAFPKGPMTLTVKARGLSIDQRFVIE
jgi:hypothetical protein